MKLILLGAPASGKGTIAAKLAKDFGYLHISAGELLRDEINKGTEIGKKIREIVEHGDLVPDHLVIEIVRLVVDKKENFILDGFPRTLHQAKDIKDLGINKAILLDLNEEKVVERITGRRVCETGKHTYHIKYLPSKKTGLCDVDGTKLIQRKDDNEVTVRERYKIYLEKTQPLIDFYKNQGILETVDGSPLPDEVYENVKKLVS